MGFEAGTRCDGVGCDVGAGCEGVGCEVGAVCEAGVRCEVGSG